MRRGTSTRPPLIPTSTPCPYRTEGRRLRIWLANIIRTGRAYQRKDQLHVHTFEKHRNYRRGHTAICGDIDAGSAELCRHAGSRFWWAARRTVAEASAATGRD